MVFTPCFLIILNNLLRMKLLNTLAPISIWLTPLNLLVSDRSPLFGTRNTWPSYHSSKSTVSSQNSVMKSKWCLRFSYNIDLKAFDGTPLSPGYLLLVNSLVEQMKSDYEGGTPSSLIPSRKSMSLITALSVGF